MNRGWNSFGGQASLPEEASLIPTSVTRAAYYTTGSLLSNVCTC